MRPLEQSGKSVLPPDGGCAMNMGTGKPNRELMPKPAGTYRGAEGKAMFYVGPRPRVRRYPSFSMVRAQSRDRSCAGLLSSRVLMGQAVSFCIRHCLVAFFLCCLALWAPAQAESGLDLRRTDFSQNGPIALDHGWAVYSGRLLTPHDIEKSRIVPDFTGSRLPLVANRLQQSSLPLGEVRTLTLALSLLMPETGGTYALRLGDIGASYRLWINGEPVMSHGRLGAESSDEVPRLGVRLVEFENDGSPIQLVLEVSSHLYAERWLVASLSLGLAEDVLFAQNRQWGGAHFFAGCLLMMGCYHLLFFCFRRKNRGPLYFGLYCLLWLVSFSASTSSDWFVLLYYPAFPVPLLHRLEAMSFIASVPIGFMFFNALFPQEFSSRVMRGCQVAGSLFFVSAATLPIPFVLLAQHLYYLVSIGLIVYVLARLIVARRHGREGAGFILWGFALLGGIAINDMLCDLWFIRSVYLIHVGLFFFILAQGLALALQFSRAFASVERLSGDLENRNAALEGEMAERSRLEREIANVSENERRFLSHSLHDGLCQHLTAARLRCAVLEQKHTDETGSRELAVLANLLQHALDQAYGLARGLWPVEHDRQRMAAFLADYCQQLALAHGVRIDIGRATEYLYCDNERVVQLYRIAQEAVTNAAKHARAQRIEVNIDYLSAESLVVMTVADDGVGIQGDAPKDGGLGMRMMAYRARLIQAELQIGHNHPSGTLVRCTIHCARCHVGCKKNQTGRGYEQQVGVQSVADR